MASATLIPVGPGRTGWTRLRAVRSQTWAKIGFAVLCAGALIGYFVYPTYPTYDSFYALLWGRDVLHLHLPDFRIYRGPTEHPLAIAFGVLCALFGQIGARLMVLGSIASFVALVAGVYRLGRLCFGPVVGIFAGLLMLSRFYDENLAAQGYLDLSYVALVVWAVALEVERPRRGALVFLVLAAAGLLRPDAWALSGVYWLWCAWPRGPERASRGRSPGASSLPSGEPSSGSSTNVAPETTTGIPLGHRDSGAQARSNNPGRSTRPPGASSLPPGEPSSPPAIPAIDNRRRLRYLGLALIAPIVWVGVDTVVTHNPLYSLQSTAGLAEELQRTQGISSVIVSVWTFGVRIDKLPVILGVLVGVPLAVWLAPRRVLTLLTALVVLVGVFVAEGAVGASVIDRYMMGAAAVALIFCAVAIGGWSMLERGSKLRRVWMLAAAALVLYGAVSAANTLSLSSLRTTLAEHEDFHVELAAALRAPAVRAQLRRCPLLSLPNNKLIPDARWILDTAGQRDIVARSQAQDDAVRGAPALEDRIRARSVAVYPLGSAVFVDAIVDPGDEPQIQIPMAGFKRIYTSRYYAVYANC